MVFRVLLSSLQLNGRPLLRLLLSRILLFPYGRYLVLVSFMVVPTVAIVGPIPSYCYL